MTAIEKILVNSEEYIRTLFEGIPIPIYVWQFVGNNFILVDYNQVANLRKKRIFKIKLGSKASIFFKNRPDILKLFSLSFNEQTTISKEIKYKKENALI